jgi:hypothetical protein
MRPKAVKDGRQARQQIRLDLESFDGNFPQNSQDCEQEDAFEPYSKPTDLACSRAHPNRYWPSNALV